MTLLCPYGLQPTRLLCPWDSPGKNTGVGCHFLLQGILLTQGSNPRLLHWQKNSLPRSCQESPEYSSTVSLFLVCSLDASLCMPVIVLFEVLYCKIKMFFFNFCVFLMYYLYEKYSKPITVWHYIANCASWVPRLTLLDLTNKLDLRTCSQNGIRLYVGDLL